jgi:hypothetical protein
MSEMSVVASLGLILVVLTAIQVYLLFSVFKWQKLIGISLGCDPSRTALILQAAKKLLRPANMSLEERQGWEHSYRELSEQESRVSPVKAGQLTQLREQMESWMQLLRKRLE